MSATNEADHGKPEQFRPRGESLETLKALARLLAREAAAEALNPKQPAGPRTAP
jgi:hypothetical protein